MSRFAEARAIDTAIRSIVSITVSSHRCRTVGRSSGRPRPRHPTQSLGISNLASNLGNVYKDFRRLPEAQATYEEVIRSNRSCRSAQQSRVVLKEQGRLDAAADAYRRAIALKPNHAEAIQQPGFVLWSKDTPVEAIPSLGNVRCRPILAMAPPLQPRESPDLAEDTPQALHCFRETARPNMRRAARSPTRRSFAPD